MENSIKTIGIIGAGQMGSGIAQVAAMHDFKVKIFDISEEALEKSMTLIKKLLDKGVLKDKWKQDFVEKTLQNICSTSNLQDFENTDIVIEAASEKKIIKFDIFKKLDQICNSNTILASNTSSISITEIAAQTLRPQKVVGMHFMNPVPVMKLVEGIKGLETSQSTFDSVKNLAQNLSKTIIEVNDVAGFAINRILMPMINEAIYAHYEGVASVKDIDVGMKLGTNQPMGPFELADFIGLDTCLYIMEVLYDGLGDSKYRPCPLLKKYVIAGRLGRKSKRGFYEY